jgi:type IV pilus assembly protein PilA
MLTMLRKRLSQDEDGFTLIELMVVVLIIAILLAIAIPTFLGAQDRARDRAAQSDLRNAVTAAKTIATDHAGLFKRSATEPLNAATLLAAEGSLSFNDTAANVDVGVITVTVNEDFTELVLVTESASEEFFAICASSTGAVTYNRGAEAPTTCDASSW